jgi:hypothetical protein
MKRNSENCVAIEATCNNILLGPLPHLSISLGHYGKLAGAPRLLLGERQIWYGESTARGGSIEQGKKGPLRTVQCGRVRNAQPKSTLPVSRTRGPQLSIQGVKVRTWVSVRKGWAAVDCGPVLTGDGDTPLYFIN